MTIGKTDSASIKKILDRLDKQLLKVGKMPHSTLAELNYKMESLKEVYYRMLLQQSKMKINEAGAVKINQYYENMEEIYSD